MELTTVARVKRALRIPAGITLHDQAIQDIVEEVEDTILNDCYLDAFVSTAYTDHLHTEPGGQRVMVVDRFPVHSIVALTVSGILQTEGSDFRWRPSGRLTFVADGAYSPMGNNEVVVTYMAGLVQVAGTTAPHLRRWATLMSALQYNQEHLAGLQTRDVEPIKYGLMPTETDQVRQEVRRIAARYARPSN